MILHKAMPSASVACKRNSTNKMTRLAAHKINEVWRWPNHAVARAATTRKKGMLIILIQPHIKSAQPQLWAFLIITPRPTRPFCAPRRALRFVQRYNTSRFRGRHIGEKSCLGRARIAEDEWDFVCPEETLNQFRPCANCRRECHKVDYNTLQHAPAFGTNPALAVQAVATTQ
jgi:hypothetical protein